MNVMKGRKQRNISELYTQEKVVVHRKESNYREEGIFNYFGKVQIYDARSLYLFYHKRKVR